MGDLVKQEVERLKEMSDEEIIKIYAGQLTGRFPAMVVVEAVGIIMEERQMEAKNMVMNLQYKDSNGEDQLLELVSV